MLLSRLFQCQLHFTLLKFHLRSIRSGHLKCMSAKKYYLFIISFIKKAL